MFVEVPSTWELRVVDDTEGQTGFRSAVALDSNGVAHISYCWDDWNADPNTSQLRYASFDESTPEAPWSFCVVSEGGCQYGFYSSLSFDSQSMPHVSFYRDYYTGGLMYATKRAPQTWFVCPDGSGDFLAIQEAIDAAVDGDVVELCDANFTGTGNRDLDFRGKAITVRSQHGPEACRIDCEESRRRPPQSPHRGFLFNTQEGVTSVLEGVTILNGTTGFTSLDQQGGGIFCNGTSPTISNCRVETCSASFGGAIGCINGARPQVNDCVLAGNTAFRGGAVYCDPNSHPTLTHCVIAGNYARGATSAGGGGGVYCSGSAPTILGCTITANRAAYYGGGIFGWCRPENTIIWGNCASTGVADEWYGDGGAPVGDCCNDINQSGLDGFVAPPVLNCGLGPDINHDPSFCGPLDCNDAPKGCGDYRLMTNSPCAPANQPQCGLIGALDVGYPAPSGACLVSEGDLTRCFIATRTWCECHTGVYLGDRTNCVPTNNPEPLAPTDSAPPAAPAQ